MAVSLDDTVVNVRINVVGIDVNPVTTRLVPPAEPTTYDNLTGVAPGLYLDRDGDLWVVTRDPDTQPVLAIFDPASAWPHSGDDDNLLTDHEHYGPFTRAKLVKA